VTNGADGVRTLKKRTVVRCIIHGGEASAGPPEHIIPEVLGGRLTIPGVCSPCNHVQCSHLDQFLAANWLLIMARVHYRLPGWEDAASRLYPNAKLPDGTKLSVRSDLRSVMSIKSIGGPPIVTEGDDGTKEVQLRVPSDANADQFFPTVKRVAERHGLPVPTQEQIQQQLNQPATVNAPQITFGFALDFVGLAVAGAKIAYEFAVQSLPSAYLDDEGAEAFRKLILDGIPPRTNPNRSELVTNGYLLPAGMRGAYFNDPDLRASMHILRIMHEGGALRVRLRLFDCYEGVYVMTPNPNSFMDAGQARVYCYDVVTRDEIDRRQSVKLS
jgi:HNH endonuclease